MAFVAKLTDRAPALVISTLFLYIFSLILFGLRCYVRLSRKTWGLDDTLMAVAMVAYASNAIVIVLGAYSGFGMHAEHFNAADTSAYQIFFAFQVTFLLDSIPVKLSIIASLYRIAVKKVYKVALWTLASVTIVGYLVTLLYVIFWCDPVSFRWNPVGLGHCGSTKSILKLSYAITAIAIFVDWSCVFIPVALLWDVKMSIRSKVVVLFLLCLGGVASISTIIRIKGLSSYVDVNDYLFGLFNIVFWSMLETGLATISASLATLRPLFRNLLDTRKSTNASSRTPYGSTLARRLKFSKPETYRMESIGDEEEYFGKNSKLGTMDTVTHVGAGSRSSIEREDGGIRVHHQVDVTSLGS